MIRARSRLVVRVTGLCALLLASQLQAAPAQPFEPREFPIGSVRQMEDLPPGRLRSELAALPPAARERGLRWLASFHFTAADASSLRADSQGGILFACQLTPGEAAVAAEPPVVAGAAVPVNPFPSELKFHSRPGAPNVLFLNFTGQVVTNTRWNTDLARAVIPAVAFSTDADPATFSDAEQTVIKRVWLRVAEDYAPFNIDVTTEAPANPGSRTAIALITRSTDADNQPNPFSTSGGVGYVNMFGSSSYATYRPVWIYYNNLGDNEAYTAEAIAHEIGHNLGLSHDGRTDGYEYYGGHGSGETSWAPIMGTGYNRNVTQWSKGEYYLASNTQDDLATIAAKLSYRPDDHGDTPGTATPLILTGGTNILSTTPETDPGRTNTANQGTLERTADVDVFSFVTGAGAIRLAVDPWIMPSGTRGGNLDLLAELYDATGVLLLTNNPAAATAALIQTNLAEGKYYLQVRNTGAGNPTNAAPDGYTAYGCAGQYFVSGYIVKPTVYVALPTAVLQTTDLTQTGVATKQFTVTYASEAGINVATLDTGDIRVTGTNGYSEPAQFVSVAPPTAGSPRVATYALPAPNGSFWQTTDNGFYTVWLQPDEVADTQGEFAPAARLGGFQVAVPMMYYSAMMDSNPGWTLNGQWQYGTPSYFLFGPNSGYTGTKVTGYNLTGNYPDNLPPAYATTPVINCAGSSSLTLRFARWLRTRDSDPVAIEVATNGADWTTVWSTTGAVSDSSWQVVQYNLPASVAGSSALRLRWSIASNDRNRDIGWHIDDVELFGDVVSDTVAPVPVLSVADVTQGGSPTHSCNVTYTDATAVRLATLDATDLLVTGPDGATNTVEFVGADLPDDGSPVTAIYSIAAPGRFWDAADNGTYTITLVENAVSDTLDNGTAAAVLGGFNVAISTTPPGALEVEPATGLVSAGMAGGPFVPASIVYGLTNAGGSSLNWTVSKSQTWLRLSASTGSLAAGAGTTLELSLDPAALALPSGVYYDTIAFINTTTGSGNTGRAVVLTVHSLPPALLAPGFAGGQFQITIAGEPFQTYVLEASTNLTDWRNVLTNTADESGTVIFPDTTSEPTRFYRSRSP